MSKCSIKPCSSKRSKNPLLTFHRFPENKSLRRKWKEFFGEENIANVKNLFVCSLHFCESAFNRTLGVVKLRDNAVPSLFLPDRDADSGDSSSLNVCRVCLSADSKLYDMKQYNLDEPYEKITGINVTGVKYPDMLCVECAQRLLNCIRFRGKCIRGHILLTEIWDTYGGLTAQSVKSVDRHQNGLVSQMQVKHIQTDHCDLYCEHTDNTDTHTDEIVTEDVEEIDTDTQSDDPAIEDIDTDTQPDDPAIDDIDSDYIEYLDEIDDDEDVDNDMAVDFVVKSISKTCKEKYQFGVTEVEANTNVDTAKEVKNVDVDTTTENNEIGQSQMIDLSGNESDSYGPIEYLCSDSESSVLSVETKQKAANVLERRPKQITKKRIGKYGKGNALAEDLRGTGSGIVRPCDSGNSDFNTMFTVTIINIKEQGELIQRKISDRYVKLTCSVCGKEFQDEVSYNNHMVRHTTKCGKYMCEVCKIYYKTARTLHTHKNMHKWKFQCNICDFVSVHRTAADNHLLYHKGVKFRCAICGQEFEKRSTYYSHLRIKHATDDHVCEFCGYSFLSQNGLFYHKNRQHKLELDTGQITSSDSPLCETCNIRFYSVDALKVHMAVSNKHNDGERRRYNEFKRRVRYAKRPGVYAKRPRGETSKARTAQSIQCEQCDEVLDTRLAYHHHFKRLHHGMMRTVYPIKREYMCEECGDIFQCSSALRDHKNKHTGERKYKCDKCEKAFTAKVNLQLHRKVHSEDRPLYECPTCGRKFTERGNRARHMIIHTGVKAFKCNVCDKAFATNYQRYAHNKYVHLKEPWPKRPPRRRKVPQPTED